MVVIGVRIVDEISFASITNAKRHAERTVAHPQLAFAAVILELLFTQFSLLHFGEIANGVIDHMAVNRQTDYTVMA